MRSLEQQNTKQTLMIASIATKQMLHFTFKSGLQLSDSTNDVQRKRIVAVAPVVDFSPSKKTRFSFLN